MPRISTCEIAAVHTAVFCRPPSSPVLWLFRALPHRTMPVINETALNETIKDAVTFIHTPLAGQLALAFSLIASAIAFGNIAMHLYKYTRPKLQRNTVRSGP